MTVQMQEQQEILSTAIRHAIRAWELLPELERPDAADFLLQAVLNPEVRGHLRDLVDLRDIAERGLGGVHILIKVYPDPNRNQICALLGQYPHSGLAGFGNTAHDAIGSLVCLDEFEVLLNAAVPTKGEGVKA